MTIRHLKIFTTVAGEKEDQSSYRLQCIRRNLPD